MRTVSNAWFRSPLPRPGARFILVCFPHAGGAASFFRPWAKYLPSSVELWAVQYPGREDRIDEPCTEDLHQLADLISDALTPVAGRSFALFGHSMGATVSYEVAIRLQRRWKHAPHALFVSASAAPSPCPHAVREWKDDDLLAEMRRLGGTSDELLARPELHALVLASVREDYRMAERYRPRSEQLLTCPVTGLVGDRDPKASISAVRGWARFTRGNFDLHLFAGDHFYLVPRRDEVIMEILHRLGAYSGTAARWSTP